MYATDDGEGSNILGAPAEAGGMPRVRSVSISGIAADTLSDPAWNGTVGTGEGTLPLPPQGGPDLPGILLKTLVAALVPGGGVPEWGVESYQPPDSPCTPPRAG